jgi:hypothetical protein
MNLGYSGIFKFKIPFNTLAVNGVHGTIEGLNSINKLLAEGIDIKLEIYSPIDITLYEMALSNNITIVTVRTSNNIIYRIPLDYIESIINDTITYQKTYLTIDLGWLPETYDYSVIKHSISDCILNNVGLVLTPSSISLLSSPVTKELTRDESTIEGVGRVAAMNNNGSYYALWVVEKDRATLLYDKLLSAQKTILKLQEI